MKNILRSVECGHQGFKMSADGLGTVDRSYFDGSMDYRPSKQWLSELIESASEILKQMVLSFFSSHCLDSASSA